MRALLLAVLLAACGGGGSSPVSGTLVSVTTLRSDLKFGYWWGVTDFLIEQADHVNLWWAVGPWPSNAWFLDIVRQAQLAKGAGAKNFVFHVPPVDAAELRFQFQRLSESGALTGWDSIVAYPLDEPETPAGGTMSEQAVADRVTHLRQVMLDTGIFAKVGVFYQCESGKRPGIKSFDLVGCYRYESTGCQLLETDYMLLRAQLSPGSRLWLIPGGADIGKVGRQDPACWASYAHRNADVWGIIGFLWQAVPDNIPRGIRDNGLRTLYCETGRTILHPNEPPRC